MAVSSQAKQLNTWRVSDYTPEYRETHSIGKRKLLTPDEVLRLPLDEALIILRGQKVLKVGKYDYTLHPESRKLKESRASDHIPEWRRLPESPEPDFSRLVKPEPKQKKPKAPKKAPAPADAVPADSPHRCADGPQVYIPAGGDCGIVMTDKKSIMS